MLHIISAWRCYQGGGGGLGTEYSQSYRPPSMASKVPSVGAAVSQSV